MDSRVAALVVAALVLSGCASGTRVVRGDGPDIATAQAEPASGGRYRIAVAAVIDKTDPAARKSLPQQLERMNASRDLEHRLVSASVTEGLRDMLTTELFNSDRFIVLEREALDPVIAEQEFSRSGRVGQATALPPAALEGAELLVLGAITGFDAGLSGGALPIPVPLGNDGDFGILKLRFARGWVAMDLRLVDARSGRVLSSVAVEGKNSRFGMDFSAFLGLGNHSSIKLPGVLSLFQNTPVQAALQKMVAKAVAALQQGLEP